jgi:hypothetical protein
LKGVDWDTPTTNLLYLLRKLKTAILLPAMQALVRQDNAVSIIKYSLIKSSPNQWVFYGEEEQSI